MKNINKLRKLLPLLIIVLLAAYAMIICLPHGHDCLEADCAICNMIDSTQDILISASLLAIAQILPRIVFMLPALHKHIVLFGEGTPVALKVKLLD